MKVKKAKKCVFFAIQQKKVVVTSVTVIIEKYSFHLCSARDWEW
jgi:hypothetical protein